MSGLKRALFGIALAGIGLGAMAIVTVALSDHEMSKAPTLILGPFIGWSFIGIGLFACGAGPRTASAR